MENTPYAQIATQKLILSWNTIFRAQIKHTVVLRERHFARYDSNVNSVTEDTHYI